MPNKFGPENPFPFHFGGGKTATQQAYDQIRNAVGVGGSAADDTGIDGLWRRARAKGLASASSSERRALLQAFPRFATDMVPYYERILGIIPDYGATRQDRVEAIVTEWYRQAVASTADLRSELESIDSRLSLLEEDSVDAIVSHFGRAFEAHDSASEGPSWDSFTGNRLTLFPNFSTHQIVRVRFTLGYTGPMKVRDEGVVIKVKRLLRMSLPSDVDFSISTETWSLGVTPMGYAALGSANDPVGDIFGSALKAYYGADPDSWLTDTSGNGHDLTSVGAASPTYGTVGLRRAVELKANVQLQSATLGAVASGTDIPFSVLLWGRPYGGDVEVWKFHHSTGTAVHRGRTLDTGPYDHIVDRTDDAASTVTPVTESITGSERFFAHSFVSGAGDSSVHIDGAEVTGVFNKNPTTFDRFSLGGSGAGQFNLHRVMVVNRAITSEEAAAVRALFL